MDGFPRYELFGSKVERKYDCKLENSRCGSQLTFPQKPGSQGKDRSGGDRDPQKLDSVYHATLSDKPDWLVTMSKPETDELFGFFFRRSHLPNGTVRYAPGNVHWMHLYTDLLPAPAVGSDTSESPDEGDSDRQRKTLSCVLLGIGALGILAGILAVIFIVIMDRPPVPITGGYVNVTNPSQEGNFTIVKPPVNGTSGYGDLHLTSPSTRPPPAGAKSVGLGITQTFSASVGNIGSSGDTDVNKSLRPGILGLSDKVSDISLPSTISPLSVTLDFVETSAAGIPSRSYDLYATTGTPAHTSSLYRATPIFTESSMLETSWGPGGNTEVPSLHSASWNTKISLAMEFERPPLSTSNFVTLPILSAVTSNVPFHMSSVQVRYITAAASESPTTTAAIMSSSGSVQETATVVSASLLFFDSASTAATPAFFLKSHTAPESATHPHIVLSSNLSSTTTTSPSLLFSDSTPGSAKAVFVLPSHSTPAAATASVSALPSHSGFPGANLTSLPTSSDSVVLTPSVAATTATRTDASILAILRTPGAQGSHVLSPSTTTEADSSSSTSIIAPKPNASSSTQTTAKISALGATTAIATATIFRSSTSFTRVVTTSAGTTDISATTATSQTTPPAADSLSATLAQSAASGTILEVPAILTTELLTFATYLLAPTTTTRSDSFSSSTGGVRVSMNKVFTTIPSATLAVTPDIVGISGITATQSIAVTHTATDLHSSTGATAITATSNITAKSVITDTPVVTATSRITDALVVTATTRITNATVITAIPRITDSPVITATYIITDTPLTTTTSVITHTPVTTTTSVITHTPVINANSRFTDAPVITATSVITLTSAITATSKITNTPVNTATSMITDTPVITATSVITDTRITTTTSKITNTSAFTVISRIVDAPVITSTPTISATLRDKTASPFSPDIKVTFHVTPSIADNQVVINTLFTVASIINFPPTSTQAATPTFTVTPSSTGPSTFSSAATVAATPNLTATPTLAATFTAPVLSAPTAVSSFTVMSTAAATLTFSVTSTFTAVPSVTAVSTLSVFPKIIITSSEIITATNQTTALTTSVQSTFTALTAPRATTSPPFLSSDSDTIVQSTVTAAERTSTNIFGGATTLLLASNPSAVSARTITGTATLSALTIATFTTLSTEITSSSTGLPLSTGVFVPTPTDSTMSFLSTPVARTVAITAGTTAQTEAMTATRSVNLSAAVHPTLLSASPANAHAASETPSTTVAATPFSSAVAMTTAPITTSPITPTPLAAASTPPMTTSPLTLVSATTVPSSSASTALAATTSLTTAPNTTSVTAANATSASSQTITTTPSSSSETLITAATATFSSTFSTTATLTTTTSVIPTTPASEIILEDTTLQLYKPGTLTCTYVGTDWSFLVLIRDDNDTKAGYQNIFGCTQPVGCNTFLDGIDLQESSSGYNTTFTLTFNNVTCLDQRLYACQEVIVQLTAVAYVSVEVPASLQKLDISVPSIIPHGTRATVSCSSRLYAHGGSIVWEARAPGDAMFAPAVPQVLASEQRTEKKFDECLTEVVLTAAVTANVSGNGTVLRCRTTSPNAVSQEIALNIV